MHSPATLINVATMYMGDMNAIVTLIMFAVYVTILSMLLKKVVSLSRKLVKSIAGSGIAFGMLSYALVVAPLNSIEAYFMDNRGLLHVIFVGPVQEEIAKFVCFLLAYIFITRWSRLSSEDLSKIIKGKSLVMLGAFVGLALAMVENLIDYSNLTMEGTLKRTIVSWPLHMITIGISAYGFNRYRITRQIGMVLGLLFGTITIHVVFNTIIVILAILT